MKKLKNELFDMMVDKMIDPTIFYFDNYCNSKEERKAITKLMVESLNDMLKLLVEEYKPEE